MKDEDSYEFNRGWEGGYRQGIRDAMQRLTNKGEYSKVFKDDTVLIKIPRENIQQLEAELDKELQYP